MVGLVDLGLLLVVDGNVEVLHVWCVPVLFLDLAVQWVAEWHSIDPASAGANTSGDDGVEASVLWNLWGNEWSNMEEQLEGLATLLTLWQDKAVGESGVSFCVFHCPVLLLVVGVHHPLVELEVCGAILNSVGEFFRVTNDVVHARFQILGEDVQQVEVLAVLVDVDFVAVLVVFWSQVHADDGLLGLGRFDVQVHFEWQMVQTVLTGLNHQVLTMEMGDTAEFADLRHVLLSWQFNIDSVGDIGLEAIEVGDQFLDFNGSELDTIEFDFLEFVRWKGVLEAPVPHNDTLVHLPEEWVTQLGFVVFQNAWNNRVMVDMVLAE